MFLDWVKQVILDEISAGYGLFAVIGMFVVGGYMFSFVSKAVDKN